MAYELQPIQVLRDLPDTIGKPGTVQVKIESREMNGDTMAGAEIEMILPYPEEVLEVARKLIPEASLKGLLKVAQDPQVGVLSLRIEFDTEYSTVTPKLLELLNGLQHSSTSQLCRVTLRQYERRVAAALTWTMPSIFRTNSMHAKPAFNELLEQVVLCMVYEVIHLSARLDEVFSKVESVTFN